MSQTLIEAVRALPRGEARGFRFVAANGEERFHSFEALQSEAERRAARLVALGLQKGDRIGLVLSDPEQFVLSFLGAVFAGVVPVPIYSRVGFSFKTKQNYLNSVRHVVRASGARLLLTQQDSLEVLREVQASEPTLELVMTAEEFLAKEVQTVTLPAVSPSDPCFLQFTSGSTALPRGVVVTHANVIANSWCSFGEHGLARRDEDVHLGWLPLYHDMGLIGFVLGPLVCNVQTVLLPTAAFARRPNSWMAAMHKYRGTITYAPNFGFALATKRTTDRDLEGLDLSSVRVAGCGAEPINADVLRAFCDRFARAGLKPEVLLPSYGMAEATLAVSFHERGTPMRTDIVNAKALSRLEAVPETARGPHAVEVVSCGRAFPEHEIRIVDGEGKRLPDRRVGEIWVRGPSVAAGYFREPAATEATFGGGWLRTGDLGYLVDGNLYVCGRIKDLIIINGTNYYPQDIEWAVQEVPGVRAHSIVAFSVMQRGEESLVVCAEGHSSEAASLREAIAARVLESTGLQVSHVAIVQQGTLPLTSSGKVQRRKTKQLFEAGELEEHRG